MTKRSIVLQKMLTLPFILLISLSVLMTSYLTWRFNQKTTLLLGEQISKQSAYRVEEKLQYHFRLARTFNESLKEPINYHLLDVNDRERLLDYITYITLRNPDIATLSYAYPDGSYMGISNNHEGDLLKKMASPATNRMFSTYNLTTNQIIQQRADYDARKRPWFIEAKALNQPVWSSIFEMYGSGKLGVTYAEALYNSDKSFIGVVGTDIVFDDLNQQLSNIRLTNNSYLFILDDKGHVIAQSDLSEKHGVSNLYQFDKSSNPLLKKAVNFIHTQDNFETKPIHDRSDFVIDGKSAGYSINYIPYVRNNGLNWYIGVVIPESDFLGEVNEVRKNTFFIWLVSFFFSVILGLLVTYLISREINGLRNKVRRVERTGGMYEHDNSYAIKEVDDLSRAFSIMSRRLYESYINMKLSNELLEDTASDNIDSAKIDSAKDTSPPLNRALNSNELTNLEDRHSFDHFLQFYWNDFASAAGKAEGEISLLMCNLNFIGHNKNSASSNANNSANNNNIVTDNQQYLGIAQDNALQQFAQVIRQCTRKTDIAAHYDNDKFAIILPYTTVDEAIILAKRITRQLTKKKITYRQETPEESHYVSVMIGIASTTQQKGIDKHELVNQAIVALATAKKEDKESYMVYRG